MCGMCICVYSCVHGVWVDMVCGMCVAYRVHAWCMGWSLVCVVHVGVGTQMGLVFALGSVCAFFAC